MSFSSVNCGVWFAQINAPSPADQDLSKLSVRMVQKWMDRLSAIVRPAYPCERTIYHTRTMTTRRVWCCNPNHPPEWPTTGRSTIVMPSERLHLCIERKIIGKNAGKGIQSVTDCCYLSSIAGPEFKCRYHAVVNHKHSKKKTTTVDFSLTESAGGKTGSSFNLTKLWFCWCDDDDMITPNKHNDGMVQLHMMWPI